MSGLTCPEVGSSRGDIGVLATRKGAQNVEVGPCLLAPTRFRAAEASSIERIVAFGGKITAKVA